MKEQIYESAKAQNIAICERGCVQIEKIQVICRVWRNRVHYNIWCVLKGLRSAKFNI